MNLESEVARLVQMDAREIEDKLFKADQIDNADSNEAIDLYISDLKSVSIEFDEVRSCLFLLFCFLFIF